MISVTMVFQLSYQARCNIILLELRNTKINVLHKLTHNNNTNEAVAVSMVVQVIL